MNYTETETIVKTVMDIMSDYEDLANCMASDDHGARLLSRLNEHFDKITLPTILKSIRAIDNKLPAEPCDTNDSP